MTDPDSVPLRKIGERKPDLADVEVDSLQGHYITNSSGLYGHREYTDIALILKNRRIQ
jgi:hypothetical protein